MTGEFRKPRLDVSLLMSETINILIRKHQVSRTELITRFYRRQDVLTTELDRALNTLVRRRIIQNDRVGGYSLHPEYYDTDDYKVRLNDEDNSRRV